MVALRELVEELRRRVGRVRQPDVSPPFDTGRSLDATSAKMIASVHKTPGLVRPERSGLAGSTGDLT
jgi:hypothetical protein